LLEIHLNGSYKRFRSI